MVYSVHEKKESVSGATEPDGRGKHGKQSSVSDVNCQKVVDHINSFPVIDSHYCRARTNKKYLDPGLNIEKMYDLHKMNTCKLGEHAVKPSYYRSVFNTCFNIGFHVPKTDRCDRCEEIKIKQKENIRILDIERKEYDTHLREKVSMRSEKKIDKERCDENYLMIVFDLENVITLPKAEVSSFFLQTKTNFIQFNSSYFIKSRLLFHLDRNNCRKSWK